MKLPTFNAEPRCKICNLYKEHKDLWSGIHTRIYDDHLSNSAVCHWLNSQIEVYNVGGTDEKGRKKLPKFNTANFSVHFSSHIQNKEETLKYARAGMKKNKSPLTSEEQLEADAVVMNAGSEDMEAYESLAEYVSDFDKILKAKMKSVLKKLESATQGISLVDQESIQKALDTVISLRGFMLKYRNEAKLASLAVDTAMGLCASAFTESFDRALDLMPEVVPPDARRAMKNEVADRMEVALPEIYSKIIKDFNLK